MNTTIPSSLVLIAGLAFAPVGQAAITATTVNQAAAAIAEITSTQVVLPGGAPHYFAYMSVCGDTRTNGSPSRLVFEFPLFGIARAEDIVAAKFNATTFGGSMGGGMVGTRLDYALFGYTGTGTPDLGSGAAGTYLAGTFSYKINSYPSLQGNLTDLDVTAFVQQLVSQGATHAGFVLRAVNTAPNTRTDTQFVVVQDSPVWAGDTPPFLALTVIPEPHQTGLAAVAAVCGLLRRRRRR